LICVRLRPANLFEPVKTAEISRFSKAVQTGSQTGAHRFAFSDRPKLLFYYGKVQAQLA
jgi:hypothetical protein